ncbi:Quinone oxidoreductase 2 [Hartmannibacter diazotrophicus]|uniref:Quinone oxidoreductase 2 n=1 Tax=Hartmannibacter diazotrophicus TaxID=1482074 RepID=A0A2C9D0L8_9HYPH|nr:SDR family oxidoreductase [Hartmannibacter diazotrophicus]SON53800.1 Quinone oxidoreductase 2 [Hartmannibacter diazotrophicus]
MSDTLLVTGASGHLGRRVIAHLLESNGVAPGRIVAATRDPAKLSDLAAKGIKVVAADFEDAASLSAAFAGVGRLLLISTDALDKPGRRLAQHEAAVAAAKAAGVKHIVYTSMPNPDDSLIPFAPDHLGTEQAIKASGLSYTLLRNSWYMDNMFLPLPPVLASGQWFTSAGEGRIANVSREDCARAAATALASSDTTARTYDITGPESLTVSEIAAIVSEVFERPIAVVQVSDEQLTQGMIAAGVPDFMAPLWTSFDANTREGKMNIQTDAVEELTGTAPMTLKAFLAANKAAFAKAA